MNPLDSSTLAPLRARLEQLHGQWRGSPAQRLWQAWLGELAGLLPAPLRARLAGGPPLRRIDWPLAGDQSVAPGERHILLLPASDVMVRYLTLPVGATRNVLGVIGFELDKHTPFSAQQLYFDARVISRDGAHAQVVLVAILRERLQAIVLSCQQAQLALQAVDTRDRLGQPLQINLLPRADHSTQPRGTRLNRWLGGAVVMLTLACMLLWLDTRQALLDAMQGAVAEQHQQVDQLQRLRNELQNSLGAARYLAQRKAAQPTVSAVLADLTDCLGADTWLEQLEISDTGEVTVSGQSAKASELITRAKRCPSLVQVRFQGIIQPDADTGRDRFSLRAQLHKENADAPSAE